MALEKFIKITFCLQDKISGAALAGNNYHVCLYDQDALEDDFLGEGNPDNQGTVKIGFPLSRISSLDSINEVLPDLYFTLKKGDKEVFRSDLFSDLKIDMDKENDLGIFLI